MSQSVNDVIFHKQAYIFDEPEASENKSWEWNIWPYQSDKYNKWFIPC